MAHYLFRGGDSVGKLNHCKQHYYVRVNCHALNQFFSNLSACLGLTIVASIFFLATTLLLDETAQAQTRPVPGSSRPLISQGDAVVSGFSGVAALKPKANAKLEDYIIIDTQSAALQVFDLSQMYGPDNARLVQAKRLNMVPANQIGQVFGVTLDDGQPATGKRIKNPVANIYATATSAYGLYLVETKKVGNQFVRERAKVGSPQASWMDGQFGPGGGPGSIWKINGRTGQVSLFANVTLNGVANSGPALGSITFDPKTRRLFVSDMQTGMIHAYDLTGREVGRFDHGSQGRTRQGLPPVAYDPNSRIPVTSPAFNAENPASWGLANQSRRVWGLAVNGGRLYYAPIEGPDIWSVGLTKGGRFANDARVEIEVFSQSGDPISAIAFGSDGTMYLSQRGQPRSAYDYKVMATPGTAEVLRYKRRRLPSGRLTWEPAPKEYAIGYAQKNRSANGGLALGYGYDEHGYIRYDVCQGTLWSTGEILRQSATPDPRLTAGGQAIVHGLQGNPVGAVKPINSPPLKAFFVDYDGQFIDPSYRGHMGGVAIWSACPKGVAKPKRPKGPLIRIAKSCSAAAFGIDLHCRVTLTSTGTVAPRGKVSFSDIGKVLSGPVFASKRPLIISAASDDPNWTCNDLPDRNLTCSIPGAIMQPGQSRSMDIVVDIAEVVDTPDWLIQNCAKLTGSKKTSCVTRGERDALIVTKFSPLQQPCIAGGPCDFEVSVFNPGKQTFDGELFLADNLTIGGVPATGITVDAVFPQHGCDIRGLTLPLDWACHTTIPPGGERLFNIQLTIPKSAVPAGATQGRNCFIASDPGLALGANGLPNQFWNNMLDPANTHFQLGRDCVNFDILPTGVIPPRNPGIPFGAKMQLSAKTHPAIFSAAGQVITHGYKVLNTGNQQITSFKLTDTKVTGIKCPALTGGVLAPGASVICLASYKTKAGDVGKDIVSTAKLTGKTANSNVPLPASVKTRVIFSTEAKVSLTVLPNPSTFSKAGEKILYRYLVHNTGGARITSSALTDSKGTKIICRPPGGAIPVGLTAFCTGIYTTRPGDVGKDITSITKLIGKTASGTVKSPPPVNTVVTFIKPPTPPVSSNKPALTLIEYTPQPATFLKANEKITYKYKVRNTGNLLIIKFELIDTKAGKIQCPHKGPLAIGAEVNCTRSYTTTSADVGRKLIESTATVTGSSVAGATDATAPGASKSAKVTLFKPSVVAKPVGKLEFVAYTPTPDRFTKANEKIQYRYEILNSGKAPIASFAIKDNKVTGIKCAKRDQNLLKVIAKITNDPKFKKMSKADADAFVFDALEKRKLLGASPPLSGGEQAVCVGKYTTKAGDVGKDIVSTASITSSAPPVAPKTAVVKFGPPPAPAISIVNKVSPGTYTAANQTIAIEYTITNKGNVPLAKFEMVGAIAKQNIKCPPANTDRNGGAIAVGASVTCTGSYKTTANDINSGRAHLWGEIVGYTASGVSVPAPNIAKATVKYVKPKPIAKPRLSMKHKCSPLVYSAAGETIICNFTVTNTGKIPVRSCQITGSKINVSCPPGMIQPGKSIVVKGVYTATPADVGKNIVIDYKLDGIAQ